MLPDGLSIKLTQAANTSPTTNYQFGEKIALHKVSGVYKSVTAV